MQPGPYISDDAVNFHFEFNGAVLRGRISEVALEDHFGARKDDPGSYMSAYRSNAEAIHAKAIHLVKLGALEPVSIQSKHC
jgi:hypothetical protein